MAGSEQSRDDYDQLVNWTARLEREAPLFRTLFKQADVRSVADVGAGSGQHAIMFASWGMDVTAIDPDPWMLERARANVAEAHSSVVVAQGGFGQVAGILGTAVDAITCTGNALPHVGSREQLEAALLDFAVALRPGGVLVLHYLNHYRVLEHGVRTIKPVVRETVDGDTFFLRVIDVAPDREFILFDFATVVRDAAVREGLSTAAAWTASLDDDPTGGWRVQTRRSAHLVIDYRAITTALLDAGFGNVELYGSHDRTPLDPDADESIIVVARRL